MKKIIETQRLILREIELSDKKGLFDLDSKPEVHRYIGTKPLQTLEEAVEVIELIQKQYQENGIGRWAVIDKASQEFLGWSGLKYFRTSLNNRIHFYDLGYRFIPKYWGKGFATEAGQAWVDYAFNILEQEQLYAAVDPDNIGSKNVLLKLGFKEKERFDYDGMPADWFELTRADWKAKLEQIKL